MRVLAVVVAAGALCVPAALAAASSPPASGRSASVSLTTLEQGVLADINAYRVRHRLAPLRLSVELTDAARQHTDEMALDGYFGHASRDGSAFWQRIERFYPEGSRSLWSVGENLLWSSPGVSAARALRLWIASPEHRKNLLTARWREIGVAAVHLPAAPGAFHGRPVTILTTDFGVRG